MKKATLLITLVTILSTTAWAQSQTPSTTLTPSETYRGEFGTSSYNRANKQYQLNGILTGVGPTIVGSTGISFGYFLDPDSLLLIEATFPRTTYRNSSTSATLYSSSRSNYTIDAKSLGAHYKHFVGNSFYWRAGVDYRTVDYRYSYDSSSEGLMETSFNGDSIAANFQIGNQWQWENFTMGCDWVGLSVPLYSNVKDKSINSAAANSSTADWYRDDIDKDSKNYLKNVNLNLVRFYLGASF